VDQTGHVLTSLADLGLRETYLLADEFSFLKDTMKRDMHQALDIYWSPDSLHASSDASRSVWTSLLAILPLIQYSMVEKIGIHLSELRQLIEKLAELMLDKPGYPFGGGVWGRYMLGRVLRAAQYQGPIWNQLQEAVYQRRASDGSSWEEDRLDGSVKTTAHALSILSMLPGSSSSDMEPVISQLFKRATVSPDYAYWEHFVTEDRRGPMFATRWVVISILDASSTVSLSLEQEEILSKSIFWLSSQQLPDGSWAELNGDAWQKMDPGFSANAMRALGVWLLQNGIPESRIHDALIDGLDTQSRGRQNKNQEMRPLVSLEEVKYRVSLDRVKYALAAGSNRDKMVSLEDLAQILLDSVPEFTVNGKKRTRTGELDLWLEVAKIPGTLTQDWVGWPPVECKNWNEPVGSGEVLKLRGKAEEMGANRAILFSSRGVTGGAHDGWRVIQDQFNKDRFITYVFDLNDLEEISKTLDPIAVFKRLQNDIITRGK